MQQTRHLNQHAQTEPFGLTAWSLQILAGSSPHPNNSESSACESRFGSAGLGSDLIGPTHRLVVVDLGWLEPAAHGVMVGVPRMLKVVHHCAQHDGQQAQPANASHIKRTQQISDACHATKHDTICAPFVYHLAPDKTQKVGNMHPAQ